MSEWKDISTAPRDGTEILTYRGAGLVAVAAWVHHRSVWCITDGAIIKNVTHWMPLPEAPQ